MAPPTTQTPFIAERFAALDEDGTRYTICFWKWKIVTTYLSGEIDTTTTGWKYETTDGQHINQTNDGGFEIAATGKRLTRE